MDHIDITRKSTNNLETELSRDGLNEFLKKNEEEFIQTDLGIYIQELISRKEISKAELARRSGMSSVYLYQLLSGKRYPSRDRLICLCIGLSCSLEETQNILKKSRFAGLYLKVRRDAILCYGIRNNMDINQINDLLYEKEEETLI